MGNFGKAFTRELGKNTGKWVSNKVFGDGHATPYKLKVERIKAEKKAEVEQARNARQAERERIRAEKESASREQIERRQNERLQRHEQRMEELELKRQMAEERRARREEAEEAKAEAKRIKEEQKRLKLEQEEELKAENARVQQARIDFMKSLSTIHAQPIHPAKLSDYFLDGHTFEQHLIENLPLFFYEKFYQLAKDVAFSDGHLSEKENKVYEMFKPHYHELRVSHHGFAWEELSDLPKILLFELDWLLHRFFWVESDKEVIYPESTAPDKIKEIRGAIGYPVSPLQCTWGHAITRLLERYPAFTQKFEANTSHDAIMNDLRAAYDESYKDIKADKSKLQGEIDELNNAFIRLGDQLSEFESWLEKRDELEKIWGELHNEALLLDWDGPFLERMKYKSIRKKEDAALKELDEHIKTSKGDDYFKLQDQLRETKSEINLREERKALYLDEEEGFDELKSFAMDHFASGIIAPTINLEEEFESLQRLSNEAKRAQAHLDALQEILEYADALGFLLEFGSFYRLVELDMKENQLIIDVMLNLDEVVCSTTYALQKDGLELKEKNMSDSDYHLLQQDYCCSLALRVARELLDFSARLESVAIRCYRMEVDTASGRDRESKIMAVGVERNWLQSVDLDRLDPSDAVCSLEHEMSFTQKHGFASLN